jgi:D-xylose transport system substrate-binding protein
VLIIQALDSDAAGVIVNSAKEQGVATIAYDRLINNCDVDFYATFDNIKVGEVEAQFVIDNAPTGNYIWLKGDQSDNNAQLVYEGHMNVIQPYIDSGDISIISEQWCKNWMPDKAMMHVENALTMVDNDIQGILAPNDGTAGGAIQALEAQGLAGEVAIAGQDADLAACQRIVEGLQTGTVYKPTYKLNDVIVEMALALANGEDVKSVVTEDRGTWDTTDNGYKEVDSYLIDVVAVDADNMMDTIIADGFHTMEEVYANIPENEWPTE